MADRYLHGSTQLDDLTDGTTSKTMTEVLAGGSASLGHTVTFFNAGEFVGQSDINSLVFINKYPNSTEFNPSTMLSMASSASDAYVLKNGTSTKGLDTPFSNVYFITIALTGKLGKIKINNVDIGVSFPGGIVPVEGTVFSFPVYCDMTIGLYYYDD